MNPTCQCCGFPVSKNDTKIIDTGGVICGVCLINLAHHLDISKLLKPRQTVGDNVSSPNVTKSRETAAIPSQNGSVGSGDKSNLNANFTAKRQHSDALFLAASSLPIGTHKPKED